MRFIDLEDGDKFVEAADPESVRWLKIPELSEWVKERHRNAFNAVSLSGKKQVKYFKDEDTVIYL